MKVFQITLILFVVIVTSYLTVRFSSPSNNNSAVVKQDKQTTFERVMDTQTIRCGYAVWSPSISVDPNSEDISGYSYDVMNAVGEKLGLDVEWVEETGWGVAEQGLVSGRYDVMCTDVCIDAPRTKRVWYSQPFTYNFLYMFVRSDAKQFGSNLSDLNDSDATIAVIPNTILDYVSKSVFPKAKRLDVNDLSGDIDVMMAVQTSKADAALSNVYTIEQFNKNNSNSLKMIEEPVRVCQGGFLLPPGDIHLKHMVDTAITQLNVTGALEKILSKHTPNNGLYWTLPAKPYEIKE